MTGRRRTIWWMAGGVAALALGWWFLAPRATPVEVVAVVTAPLEVLVEESGETRAVNHAVVTAPVAGLLRPAWRDAGATVAAGDPIARLEPVALDARTRTEAEARLARAEALRRAAAARLRAADSAMRDAERSAARASSLAAAGAVAPREVEATGLATVSAREAHAMAEAAVREAEAEWRAARSATASGGTPVTVRAPVAGRVLTVHERDVRVVPSGTPLVTLGDVATVEVWLDVLSRDALRLRPGQLMRLDLGPGLEGVPGEVVRVEPGGFARLSPLGVEERRVRVVGRPRAPLPGVGDGYRALATIVVWADEAVLQVPASAFVRDGAGWAVYVLASGTVRRRTVTPGERGARSWQVLDGLAAGDVVVRFPGSEIVDGMRGRAVGG
jgi:HlyD family secretion protein